MRDRFGTVKCPKPGKLRLRKIRTPITTPSGAVKTHVVLRWHVSPTGDGRWSYVTFLTNEQADDYITVIRAYNSVRSLITQTC